MKFFKSFAFLLAIGFFLRVFLMFYCLHPDVWAVLFSEYLFAFKGVFNIYDYLAGLGQESAIISNYGNFFTYPPLAYFTFGVFGVLFKPFFNYNFLSGLADNLPQILNDSRLYWHLFLAKLPYLLFDLGILIVLPNLVDKGRKKIIQILWLFNPASIYASYMIGQFDIIPVFFMVLSLYFFKRSRISLAALILGIGGGYKMFPLFFLPFLASEGGRNYLAKFKYLSVGIATYVISIFPFIFSANFRQNVLFSNQSQKMLFAKIPVSGAEYLSVFLVLYFFLIGVSFFKNLYLWKWFLAVLLLFFSVTHYHPQWFLWISPLLLIFAIEHKKYLIMPLILVICWITITLLFEPSLSVSLFSPINPSLQSAKPLSEYLSGLYSVFDFKSIVRSLFAGVSLTMTVLLFRNEKTE